MLATPSGLGTIGDRWNNSAARPNGQRERRTERPEGPNRRELPDLRQAERGRVSRSGASARLFAAQKKWNGQRESCARFEVRSLSTSSPPNYGKNGRAASLPSLGARAKNLSPGSLIAWPGRSVCLPRSAVSCYAPTSFDDLPNRCEVIPCRSFARSRRRRSRCSFRISSR